MSTLKKDFASKLLEVKAIKLQPNDPFHTCCGCSRLSSGGAGRPEDKARRG